MASWRPLLPHLAIISSALERDSFGLLTEVTQNLLASARDIRSFSRRNSQELGWTETGIGLIGLIGLNMTEYCWKILLQPSGSGLDCEFSSRPTFGASWRICSTGASKDRKLVSCGFGTVCFGASMCCSRNCCSWFAYDRWSAIANANKIRQGYMILWSYKSYYKSYYNTYYTRFVLCPKLSQRPASVPCIVARTWRSWGPMLSPKYRELSGVWKCRLPRLPPKESVPRLLWPGAYLSTKSEWWHK